MAAARDNLDNGMILTLGVLLVVLLFVLILLLQGWFYKAQHDEHVRKVIEPRSEELASSVAAQREALHRYRLLDAGEGRVALPIDRAMQLVVREGL
jgi:hypothetical protein